MTFYDSQGLYQGAWIDCSRRNPGWQKIDDRERLIGPGGERMGYVKCLLNNVYLRIYVTCESSGDGDYFNVVINISMKEFATGYSEVYRFSKYDEAEAHIQMLATQVEVDVERRLIMRLVRCLTFCNASDQYHDTINSLYAMANNGFTGDIASSCRNELRITSSPQRVSPKNVLQRLMGLVKTMHFIGHVVILFRSEPVKEICNPYYLPLLRCIGPGGSSIIERISVMSSGMRTRFLWKTIGPAGFDISSDQLLIVQAARMITTDTMNFLQSQFDNSYTDYGYFTDGGIDGFVCVFWS